MKKIITACILTDLMTLPLVSQEKSLFEAAAANDIPAIKVLIEKGADPRRVNSTGETAEEYAREKGAYNGADFLRSIRYKKYSSGTIYVGQMKMFNGCRYSGEFSEGKFHGLGYWYYSSGKGYAGEFRNNQFYGRNELFEEKKVHKPDTYGETQLYQSARRGRLTQVRLLLERGADVNIRSNQKQTPLHYAAFEGYLSIVRILVKHGALVSPVDRDGMTPLHFAADAGKTAMVRLLINNGAAVNARNKLGVTPLMHAVYRDSDAVVELLLEKGANRRLRDYNGRRAIDHAKILKSYRSLRILRSQKK